ncbi:MAG: UvrD-helicase domain-containing protein [Bacillota bacterium]|nr:UvrD-helicase domain-containing protein [Bacillota bacterium]MDW7677271.1 UvrD-helicase domain-containing protein [Bacillota bacterium]
MPDIKSQQPQPDTVVLADQAARDNIRTVFDRNFLVEAGAGSGKTTSLTQRMVASVAAGHVKADQMAAITFTRKAAAELKERFQEELERARQKTETPEQQANLEAALKDMHRCNVGTIHSFCASLLRERPVEAGIDPEFTELDETENQLRQADAWEDFLVELKASDSPLLPRLEAVGISPDDLKDAARNLAEYPDVIVHILKTEAPDLNGVKLAISRFVEQVKPCLPAQEPEKGYDRLQLAVRQAERMLRRMPLKKPPEIMDLVLLFDKNLDVTLNRWDKMSDAREFKEATPRFQENHIKPAVLAWRAYCHPIITEFLLAAVAWYSEVRRKNGWINFQDLLLLTAALLRDNPEVRRYFQQKYQCLLVDEFQDTDPIQAEIVFFLTGTDVAETNWQQLVPRPGSLFVVGDPKQSIYRFRRADIDLYQQVKKRIRETGGEVLELTANFRSVNALSRHLNPLFKEILPSEATSAQAAFAPLETQAEGKPGLFCGPKVLQVSAGCTRKEDIIAEDARSIARFIRESIDHRLLTGSAGTPAVYSDFLILTRYKDGIEVYTRELENRQIPYRVAGGSDFHEVREVKETLNLLHFLENPADAVRMAAVLRGLFFGLSDDQLYQYKRSGGRFALWAQIPEDCPEAVKGLVTSALERLNTYHDWLCTLPFSVTLENIMADTGLLPTTWMQAEGRARCGHLLYLMEYLKKQEAAGTTTAGTLLESLQALLDSGVEEELDITGEQNVVRIMNLHKAKGLEAPVVFLAQPAKLVNRSPDRHIRRSADQAVGCWVYSVAKGSYGSKPLGMTLDWPEWEQEEAIYQDAEEDRLLYVAATRARNALIISSCKNDRKNPWQRLLKGLEEEDMIQMETVEVPSVTEDTKTAVDEIPDASAKLLEDWVTPLAIHTYRHTTPTTDKDLEALWDIGRAAGGGQAWGTVVHLALEHLVHNGTAEGLPLERWLAEAGLQPERTEELAQMLRGFQNTPLWQRIRMSPCVYTEVPFHLKVAEGHDLYPQYKNEVNGPVYLAGVIDLVFKENDGWVMVDYKTDRLEDPANYPRLEEAYRPQLRQYKAVWEHITGETVTDMLIHFLAAP